MRSFCVLWMCAFLCGCSFFRPFVDARKEAGRISTVGQSRADAPAVCYHPLWNKMEKVQQIAQVECQKLNKTAVLQDKKYFSCSLIAPVTAFYECQK